MNRIQERAEARNRREFSARWLGLVALAKKLDLDMNQTGEELWRKIKQAKGES